MGLRAEQSPILNTAGTCSTVGLLRKRKQGIDRQVHTTLIHQSHRAEKRGWMLKYIWTMTQRSKYVMSKISKREKGGGKKAEMAHIFNCFHLKK